MKSHPLYILIPVYNAADYLEEFCTSLFSILDSLQLPSTTTLLFLDDCSQDKSVSILQKQCQQVNYNIIIKKNTRNLGHHANTLSGIMTCNTPSYILTMDADFQPSPEILKTFIPFCMQSDSELIIGNFNPHPFGWRRVISFGYNLYLSLKTKKNLLPFYGSSLKFFFLNPFLQTQLDKGRIEIHLLNYFKHAIFFEVNESYLKNYRKSSYFELIKNIITTK